MTGRHTKGLEIDKHGIVTPPGGVGLVGGSQNGRRVSFGGILFVDWWGVKIPVGCRWGDQEDFGGIFAHKFQFSVFFNQILPFSDHFIVDILSVKDFF